MAHELADAEIDWTGPFTPGVLAEVRLVTAASLFACACLHGANDSSQAAYWTPMLGVCGVLLVVAILRLSAAVNEAYGLGEAHAASASADAPANGLIRGAAFAYGLLALINAIFQSGGANGGHTAAALLTALGAILLAKHFTRSV